MSDGRVPCLPPLEKIKRTQRIVNEWLDLLAILRPTDPLLPSVLSAFEDTLAQRNRLEKEFYDSVAARNPGATL